MINGTANEAEAQKFLTLLAKLSEIAPVYVSYGNHEQQYLRKGGADLAPGIAEAGAALLNDNSVITKVSGNTICLGGTLGHLLLYGRNAEQYHSSPEYQMAQEMLATGLPTIILAHLPDTIAFEYAYRDWDIDLFLSGHTHGGVIRIPGLGGIYAPMQDWFPKYDIGYFDLGKTKLIISSGLSGHGSIPRIFNRPEICVVHIKP